MVTVLVGGLVLFGLAIFMFGQDLFGSDRATIDDYNQQVLESCDLPEESTLVRKNVQNVTVSTDRRVRAMTYIWASALSAQDTAAFYGAPGPGVWTRVPEERSCLFSQRPSLLVLERWAEGSGPIDASTQTTGPGDPFAAEFWAGEGAETISDITTVPDTTQSFFLLVLAQDEVDGIFGTIQVSP